jgi:hypothetical protein
MMRLIVGANSFAHKALNRRVNSPLHQAQLRDLGSPQPTQALPSGSRHSDAQKKPGGKAGSRIGEKSLDIYDGSNGEKFIEGTAAMRGVAMLDAIAPGS